MAWRDGMLAFDGETLREATAEVERNTGVRFVFTDPSLGNMRIGGYVSASDAEGFIALPRDSLDLAVQRRSETVVAIDHAAS